jgi:hypothetical protein
MRLRSIAVLTIGALAAVAYWTRVRPWHIRWGCSAEELAATLPGDELNEGAPIASQHAITIDAPAEEAWKWLVQIGQGRAGFYSYTVIENLMFSHMQNADEIHPEWQDVEQGDMVRTHPRVALPVRRLVPGEAMVLGNGWIFHLRKLDDRASRLHVRTYQTDPRIANPVAHFLYWRCIYDPMHFIMERGMLRGLKRRAERSYAMLPEESAATPEIPA